MWEYRTTRTMSPGYANLMGSDGWELVTVSDGNMYWKRLRRKLKSWE